MICGSIWNLANKEHQTLSYQFFINRSSILMFFVLFFHVVCKISNFDIWTAKLLEQASCTELSLILPFFYHLPTSVCTFLHWTWTKMFWVKTIVFFIIFTVSDPILWYVLWSRPTMRKYESLVSWRYIHTTTKSQEISE